LQYSQYLLGLLWVFYRSRTNSTRSNRSQSKFESSFQAAEIKKVSEQSAGSGSRTAINASSEALIQFHLRQPHYSSHIDGDEPEQVYGGPPTSTVHSASSTPSGWSDGPSRVPQRHIDAGLVLVSMSERRLSDSLPPAYGEQISQVWILTRLLRKVAGKRSLSGFRPFESLSSDIHTFIIRAFFLISIHYAEIHGGMRFLVISPMK